MPLNRFAAGQSADGLVDHRLENGHCQVLLCGPLIDQRLDIGLGEDSAAGSDWVDGIVAFGIFIKACRISLEQTCHLVDKRSGTTGADTIHSLLDAALGKVDDLGILPSQLNSHIGLRLIILQSLGHADHLLAEGNMQIL